MDARQYPGLQSRSALEKADFIGAAEGVEDLVAELSGLIEGEVRFDGYSRMLYSTDASQYQIQPLGVVLPRSAEDVEAVYSVAARHGVPILPRGGGSSLAGQAVGAGLVVDMSKYLDRILGIDEEAGVVTVEPGITVGALNRRLAPLGWMLGPDPASADRATLGGSIGNNATGSHSILYGMLADHVLEVESVLSDGSRVRLGGLDAAGVAARARGDSLEARLYQEIPALIESIQGQILESWPRHWRRASGYNLDRLAAALLPPQERGRLSFDSRYRPAVSDPSLIDRFNLAQLITGSEGTLAAVVGATLNLVRRPQATGLAVVHFDSVEEACAAIPDILDSEPSASELLDKHLMDLARAQPEWAKRLHFVEGDPAAVLLTEFYVDDEGKAKGRLESFVSHLRSRGIKNDVRLITDPVMQADVWAVRKAGLNLLMSRRGDYKPVPGIEDVSVPQEVLADYLERILDYSRTFDDVPGVAVYAHASAGCLHVRPLLNLKRPDGIEIYQALGNFACDLAVEYGGTMSGEHGDGLARSELNERLFGPELYSALRRVKAIFDPDNRLNPGKIVDAPPRSENLRFGASYQTIQLETVFDWRDDRGFAGAIEMCNGAGVCRKLGSGTMCPSYMATKDEQDTTRGRANALRNVLAGRIPADELYSPEMYDVMDLCIGCKACSSECPSSVDMARIKAEFLVHYYQVNGLPLMNRLMGALPQLDEQLYRWAAPLVPLLNRLIEQPVVRALQRRIGVDHRRTLPHFASERFSRWFAAHGGRNRPQNSSSNDGERTRDVILFHDTWAEFHEPGPAQAALKVLEAVGYRVSLAAGRACCGRPLITGGQADRARGWVDHNVALLAPFAAQGIPIVGIEPSCILTLRDEYMGLASDRERARILAEQALTFEEFLLGESEDGALDGLWREDLGRVHLHGHCHQKALVGNEASIAALALAGYEVEVIPSGCCGMAGDFGYGVDHYEISRRIGEDRLFPAVRAAASEDLIVASGISCRQQIGHFTERRPVHLTEALAAALR